MQQRHRVWGNSVDSLYSSIYTKIYILYIQSTHDKLSNRELRASKPKSPNFISRFSHPPLPFYPCFYFGNFKRLLAYFLSPLFS